MTADIPDPRVFAQAWGERWHARLCASADILDPDLAADLHDFCLLLVSRRGRTDAAGIFAIVQHARRVFDPARTRQSVEGAQHHGIQALGEVIVTLPVKPAQRLGIWNALIAPWLTHPYFAIAALDELGGATDQARVLGVLMRHLWLLGPREGIRLWRALPGDATYVDVARAGAPVTAAPTDAALLDQVMGDGQPAVHEQRLLAPLYAADDPFAIIDVHLPAEDPAVRMLQVLGLAQATSHALSTVAQHQQATPSVIWQRVLTSLAQTLNDAASAESVILTVAQHLRHALPCERVGYWTYNAGARTFRLEALSARITAKTLPVGSECVAEDTPLQVAWHTGQPLLLDEHWPDTFPGFPNASGSIHVMAVAPLVYELSTIGVLTIERLEHRPFTHQDADWLMVVGAIAASALHGLQMRASLREAQQRATEDLKMRALGEMAAGIAHDFNNLLMALLCHVEMMGMASEMRQVHSRLPHLERAIADGRAIVQRVSTFGKRTSDAPMAPVRLGEVLHDVAGLYQPQFAPLGITCTVACPGDVWVLGIATELREVVTNLVTNAMQAMPDGGALALACGTDGGAAWFSVHDTGVGMPPAVVARAFEPFFSTKGGLGTGLGLAVSYQIVRRHGGTLAIDSREGEGTTIRAELPMATAPVSHGDAAADTGPRLRILLVEDHPDIAEMLTHMLRGFGHAVVHAADVERGVRLIAQTPPDVIITDFMVGSSFGDVVAHAAASAAPAIPVILLSGSTLPAEGHERLYAVVLQKPVSLASVRQALTQALAH